MKLMRLRDEATGNEQIINFDNIISVQTEEDKKQYIITCTAINGKTIMIGNLDTRTGIEEQFDKIVRFLSN